MCVKLSTVEVKTSDRSEPNLTDDDSYQLSDRAYHQPYCYGVHYKYIDDARCSLASSFHSRKLPFFACVLMSNTFCGEIDMCNVRIKSL